MILSSICKIKIQSKTVFQVKEWLGYVEIFDFKIRMNTCFFEYEIVKFDWRRIVILPVPKTGLKISTFSRRLD